jgi:hypothetical protein
LPGVAAQTGSFHQKAVAKFSGRIGPILLDELDNLDQVQRRRSSPSNWQALQSPSLFRSSASIRCLRKPLPLSQVFFGLRDQS